MMGNKVRMEDIAARLGISKVSVSKAINNQPGIGDTLREQILQLSLEMGYIKHKETSLKHSFALVTPKRFFLEDDTFYTTIYYYINNYCTKSDYNLRCFVIDTELETHNELPPQLMTDSYSGIFLCGELSPSYLSKLMDINAVFIAIDFYNADFPMDCVISDNYYMGYEVTNYLIKRGHKRIGFVGNITQTSSICDRYFGYLKALKLNGLTYNDSWQLSNNNPLSGEYIVDIDIPTDIPSAFVCHCDKSAVMLIRTLTQRGINVPDDVSVISFDNASICDFIVPKLTTVQIDRKAIAEQSMSLMLNRLQNPRSALQRYYNGCSIVERDSVK